MNRIRTAAILFAVLAVFSAACIASTCGTADADDDDLTVTVSPIGLDDGCTLANNGADYGPDTDGTTTSGIQEAIDYIEYVNDGILDGNVSISDEDASGTVILLSGTYYVTSEIVLCQGVTLDGNGRLSTVISLSTEAGDWLADMDAIILIPADENECTIQDLSIKGFRTEDYEDYSIDGILILGYNWRPVIQNVEIVDCQGSGIETDTGDSSDTNAIVYEPILDNVSVISCYYGITLSYCADDALYSVNIENCSEDGIRYYGGNGKWTDVHVYLNKVGMRIAGQPLRITNCSLDTNLLQGAIVEEIDTTISPGAVIFDSPLAQGNGADATTDQEATAILILGQNVVINDMISINKSDNVYQMYAVVEQGNADCNTIVGLTSTNVANTVLLIGSNSSYVSYASMSGESTDTGYRLTVWMVLLAILAALVYLTLRYFPELEPADVILGILTVFCLALGV